MRRKLQLCAPLLLAWGTPHGCRRMASRAQHLPARHGRPDVSANAARQHSLVWPVQDLRDSDGAHASDQRHRGNASQVRGPAHLRPRREVSARCNHPRRPEKRHRQVLDAHDRHGRLARPRCRREGQHNRHGVPPVLLPVVVARHARQQDPRLHDGRIRQARQQQRQRREFLRIRSGLREIRENHHARLRCRLPSRSHDHERIGYLPVVHHQG